MSRSQKAQGRRQDNVKSDPWAYARTATIGPKPSDVVSPVPYSLRSKEEEKKRRREQQRAKRQRTNGQTQTFEINSNLLAGVCKQYRRSHPDDNASKADVIHKALASYREDLKLSRRLIETLSEELS